MSPRFQNPVVLVTGAAAGIGRAAGLAFAREGAYWVVSGRHVEAGNRLRPARAACTSSWSPLDSGSSKGWTASWSARSTSPAVAATISAGRMGEPDEVADAILDMAPRPSSSVTGQVLAVNGGKTAM